MEGAPEGVAPEQGSEENALSDSLRQICYYVVILVLCVYVGTFIAFRQGHIHERYGTVFLERNERWHMRGYYAFYPLIFIDKHVTGMNYNVTK